MIRFNVPPFTGKEFDYMKKAVENEKSVAMVNLRRNAVPG